MTDTGVNRLTLHDHTRKASVGIIVHTAVLVGGVVAQVVDMYVHEPLALGPGQNGHIDKAFQHLRQDCDNIYSHNVAARGRLFLIAIY